MEQVVPRPGRAVTRMGHHITAADQCNRSGSDANANPHHEANLRIPNLRTHRPDPAHRQGLLIFHGLLPT
jgi:hypothetical protein